MEPARRAAGAGLIDVNPLHALFAHNPDRASPYSASSRVFPSVLHIDVESIRPFAECETAPAKPQL